MKSETNYKLGHDPSLSSANLVQFRPRTLRLFGDLGHCQKFDGENVLNRELENVAIANALQLEAVRRRAVPVRFNFIARIKFELALPTVAVLERFYSASE